MAEKNVKLSRVCVEEKLIIDTVLHLVTFTKILVSLFSVDTANIRMKINYMSFNNYSNATKDRILRINFLFAMYSI